MICSVVNLSSPYQSSVTFNLVNMGRGGNQCQHSMNVDVCFCSFCVFTVTTIHYIFKTIVTMFYCKKHRPCLYVKTAKKVCIHNIQVGFKKMKETIQ